MKQWKTYILSCIWGPMLIAQMLLVLVFGLFNKAGLNLLVYAGCVIWVFSIVLGWMPILVLKRRGGVAKSKSYVHTTTLVKTGIYSIVRHPQYTAGILLSLALVLVSQSWLVTLIGVVVMPLLYVDIAMADKHEIEKFGDAYKDYMEKVPRANFLLGIIRLLKSRKRK